MHTNEKNIYALIEKARRLGLGEVDLNHAQEELEYFEPEVAFDTIVTQMHEYGVKIDLEFLRMVDEICDLMKIQRTKYSFLMELLEDRSDPISGPF